MEVGSDTGSLTDTLLLPFVLSTGEELEDDASQPSNKLDNRRVENAPLCRESDLGEGEDEKGTLICFAVPSSSSPRVSESCSRVSDESTEGTVSMLSPDRLYHASGIQNLNVRLASSNNLFSSPSSTTFESERL